MGKGDQRTKRGKIWRGTFGKRRPRKRKKTAKGSSFRAEGAAPPES